MWRQSSKNSIVDPSTRSVTPTAIGSLAASLSTARKWSAASSCSRHQAAPKRDREVASALADWTRDDTTDAEGIKVLEVMVGDPATAPSIWRQLRRYAALAREQSAALRSPPIDYYEGGADKPLFIVQGLADRSAPPENARQLRDRFPTRVRFMEMPGVGHMPFLEQPDKVANAVLSFLQEQ